MLAPGRPSTNNPRARENAVRASSWRWVSASVGSHSARRIRSENAGAVRHTSQKQASASCTRTHRSAPSSRSHNASTRLTSPGSSASAGPARPGPTASPSPSASGGAGGASAPGGGLRGARWGEGAGAKVVGEGAVGPEGGAAQRPQLAGVEAAEGGGEEGG